MTFSACQSHVVLWMLLLLHKDGQPQSHKVVLLWCIFTGWEQSNYPLKLNVPNKSCFTSRAAGAHWQKQCEPAETRTGTSIKDKNMQFTTHMQETREKSQTVVHVSPYMWGRLEIPSESSDQTQWPASRMHFKHVSSMRLCGSAERALDWHWQLIRGKIIFLDILTWKENCGQMLDVKASPEGPENNCQNYRNTASLTCLEVFSFAVLSRVRQEDASALMSANMRLKLAVS